MRKTSIILFALAFMTMSSCSHSIVSDESGIIDYPIDEISTSVNNSLAISCVLTNSDLQELFIFGTEGSASEELKPISGAYAELFIKKDGTPVSVGVFSESDGRMTLSYTPKAGNVYQLKVSYKDYNVSAETTMPEGAVRTFVPNPITYFYNNIAESNSDNHYFEAYPSYSIITSEKSLPIWAYMKNDGKLVEKIYTTCNKVYDINSTKEKHSFSYEVVDGIANDRVTYKTHYETVEYPIHTGWVKIEVSKEYLNSYYYCLYTPELPLHSSYFPVESITIKELISQNPECQTKEKDNFVWGSSFDICPAAAENADELYLLVPSKELDLFLGYAMKVKVANIDDFSQYPHIQSYYSNIQGASGIFGAANISIEKYEDILSRTIDSYKNTSLKRENN